MAQYALRECRYCETVFIDPLPTPSDLDAMYRFGEQFSHAVYTDASYVEIALSYLRGAVVGHRLLPTGTCAVLEIGAGLAWMCRAVRELRADASTFAQDISAEGLERCPWVDRYFLGNIEDLPDRGPFQLISMTHVIEHLLDPTAMIERATALLDTGGHLFVTAPYRPSGWPQCGADAWRSFPHFHVPAHVSYLSRAWFEMTAARCGLTVTSWDATHDEGRAFEVVMTRSPRSGHAPSRLVQKAN